MFFNIKVILASSMLLIGMVGCGSSESSKSYKAEMDIGALQIGKSTIFRTTLKNIPKLSDAKTYNLIGENSSVNPKNIGEQVENYVLNKTTIPLEIYNTDGKKIMSSTLNLNNFKSKFSGSVIIDENRITINDSTDKKNKLTQKLLFSPSSKSIEMQMKMPPLPSTIDDLNILATGVIDNLSVGTRTIKVPLICGTSTVGNLKPIPNKGFFIINNVMVEFNYAFDNPEKFNNLFTIKFIESGRDFQNMKLYFRMPNTTEVIEGLSGKILSQIEANSLFNTIIQAIDKNNPFQGIGIADVDLTINPFGSLVLVETKVTKVEGNCIVGAKSFTVRDGSEKPEPAKEIGDIVDKNTDKSSLALYILGNEIEVREAELNVCDEWSVANSGGAAGTYDRWDISDIPNGASFDFRFDAYSIPDKFRVEYPTGTVKLQTGWRGGSSPDTGELLEGTGSFEKYGLFIKGASNTMIVLVTGEQSGTAWDYQVRCVEKN